MNVVAEFVIVVTGKALVNTVVLTPALLPKAYGPEYDEEGSVSDTWVAREAAGETSEAGSEPEGVDVDPSLVVHQLVSVMPKVMMIALQGQVV